MPSEGAALALINWGSTRHPTLSLSDNGCRLDRFVINTPFAEDLGSIIKKILFDERIRVKFSQQISFEAHIETPFGKVILK